jgi:xanthine dehydrogenase accessory factor
MIRTELAGEVEQLIAQRTPFVVATVVRARRPTSVRPGDTAIVLADGTIEGFVGGVCAASSVRLHSLRALETGEPLLLRLIPDDDAAGDRPDAIDGAVVERNPCLSGGSLEIFLEPRLPAARLVIIGGSPIALALGRVGAAAGYDCVASAGGDPEVIDGATAVVVASHGNHEEAVLAAALRAGVPYVALVASRRRGGAVRAELEVDEQLRAQLHTPAGLDIGARTPEEIAVSILAELVARVHADPVPGRAEAEAEAQVTVGSEVAVAIDPACGMRVAITDATPRLSLPGGPAYFCSEGCRDGYAREHAGELPTR